MCTDGSAADDGYFALFLLRSHGVAGVVVVGAAPDLVVGLFFLASSPCIAMSALLQCPLLILLQRLHCDLRNFSSAVVYSSLVSESASLCQECASNALAV